MSGITEAMNLVLTERCRQVDTEGFTPERDDQYHQCELARAAACYATPRGWRRSWQEAGAPFSWPWPSEWWKPAPFEDQSTDARIRELVKAGALILAEIERLQRKAGA